ncbi:hypothetical protein PybrP1_005073 [[Pythium] brassicae (nom. inval.)]|nr:hypothetical protein PybrP1_005073 [[Pythium] brassicae (nom. inval.)]
MDDNSLLVRGQGQPREASAALQGGTGGRVASRDPALSHSQVLRHTAVLRVDGSVQAGQRHQLLDQDQPGKVRLLTTSSLLLAHRLANVGCRAGWRSRSPCAASGPSIRSHQLEYKAADYPSPSSITMCPPCGCAECPAMTRVACVLCTVRRRARCHACWTRSS